MYSLSKSIDFYWLIFRGCPEQRSPHPVQCAEFEAVAAHFDMDPDRIATAASDGKYLGSLGLLASIALAGGVIAAYEPTTQHTNIVLALVYGSMSFALGVFSLRLRRLGWRLKHRQMGGWYELVLPSSWASVMREPVTRGSREETSK